MNQVEMGSVLETARVTALQDRDMTCVHNSLIPLQFVRLVPLSLVQYPLSGHFISNTCPLKQTARSSKHPIMWR